MSRDSEDQGAQRKSRTRIGRGLKYAFVATYLMWLALVPEWATLGLRSTPMLAEEAELDDSDAEHVDTVSWELLGGFSYEFDTPAALEDVSPDVLAQRNERLIPAEVRSLDRRTVAVRGYAIPVVMKNGRTTEFILAAKNELGCCFGDGLSMNQWIHVAAPEGDSFDVTPFAITTVLGVLEVGEDVRMGTVLSLYRMNDATVQSG